MAFRCFLFLLVPFHGPFAGSLRLGRVVTSRYPVNGIYRSDAKTVRGMSTAWNVSHVKPACSRTQTTWTVLRGKLTLKGTAVRERKKEKERVTKRKSYTVWICRTAAHVFWNSVDPTLNGFIFIFSVSCVCHRVIVALRLDYRSEIVD